MCIPAILNEYRTAELNVRTGCLNALTFVFGYISPQSAYYVDLVVTMLEDALTDRDLVHRQTVSVIVQHLALGVAGLSCEDSMLHLMNLVTRHGPSPFPCLVLCHLLFCFFLDLIHVSYLLDCNALSRILFACLIYLSAS